MPFRPTSAAPSSPPRQETSRESPSRESSPRKSEGFFEDVNKNPFNKEFVAEVVDEPRETAEATAVEGPPILQTAAEFLGRAAVGVARLDPKAGAKIGAAAVATKVIANDADAILASGKQLYAQGKRLKEKYTPMIEKALTPGLERRALVDMHTENYRRGR